MPVTTTWRVMLASKTNAACCPPWPVTNAKTLAWPWLIRSTAELATNAPKPAPQLPKILAGVVMRVSCRPTKDRGDGVLFGVVGVHAEALVITSSMSLAETPASSIARSMTEVNEGSFGHATIAGSGAIVLRRCR